MCERPDAIHCTEALSIGFARVSSATKPDPMEPDMSLSHNSPAGAIPRSRVKDTVGRGSQSESNRAAYLRRKANGYYANKLADKSQAECDEEAEDKRVKRHALGATPRATNAELRRRRQVILEITREQQPATVRAIFYQCVVVS